MMWGYGFSWGGMWLMLLSMGLFIALLVVVVWAIIRWLDRRTSPSGLTNANTPPTSSGPSALEILGQRYARGEIDTATFEQMRERLDPDGLDGPNGADRVQLSARLEAGADDPQSLSLWIRQQVGGIPARGAGTYLSQVIGFHHGQGLSGLSVVEHEVEVRAVARIGGVKLGSEVVAIRSGHAMQHRAGFEDQSPPWLVLCAALRQGLECFAHNVDGVAHGQQFLNIGFREIEHQD